MQRREFIRLMGLAPGAMAAPWDLSQTQQKLFSHFIPPENQVPADQWIVNRAMCTECPAGCGLLVKAREGHPIKLEGDPDHPINRGGLCIRGQASLGRLYHPERVKQPMLRQENGTLKALGWDEAFSRINEVLNGRQDRHLYLSGRTTGALNNLIDVFTGEVGVERLPELELFHHGAIRTAYETLYGLKEVPAYHCDRTDLLITVGADLLESFVSPVRFAREVIEAKLQGVRWFHLEPHFSLTGSNATDHLQIKPGSEAWLLAYLLTEYRSTASLTAQVMGVVPAVTAEEVSNHTGLNLDVIDTIALALRNSASPLIISGGMATAHENGLMVALLTGLLQEVTGAVGNSVDFTASENYEKLGTLEELRVRAGQLQRSEIGAFFISGVHSVEHSPEVEVLVDRAELAIAVTDLLYPHTQRCGLILPASHGLESWSASQPKRGLYQVTRPVFTPLFDTMAEGDILLRLMGRDFSFEDYMRGDWIPRGLDISESAVQEIRVSRRTVSLRSRQTSTRLAQLPLGDTLREPVLIITSSLRTFDGRSQPIAMLQEVPDPVTAVSYGHSLNFPSGRADRTNLKDGDEVVVSVAGGSTQLAARISPLLDDSVLSASIDHVVGLRLSIDRSTGELIRIVPDFSFEKTGRKGLLTILSGSMEAEGREILPDDIRHVPGLKPERGDETRRLYQAPEHTTYRWAMAIDLDRCTGCSACVASCYVENNIPIVGPDEHRLGREMSWLRVQPYLDGERSLEFLPMMCQQCDSAPCEAVCPVFATYHNPEGLNAQIYNRCVGTRYCANNCPYKARRFNWFDHQWQEPLELMLNPDVSVRPRGVMEKCTFCIQRIREGKDLAKDEGRLVREGDFTTACAQSCPTGAIVFGNLLEEESEVYRLAHSDRAYRVLSSLGTGPAVYYLRTEENHES